MGGAIHYRLEPGRPPHLLAMPRTVPVRGSPVDLSPAGGAVDPPALDRRGAVAAETAGLPFAVSAGRDHAPARQDPILEQPAAGAPADAFGARGPTLTCGEQLFVAPPPGGRRPARPAFRGGGHATLPPDFRTSVRDSSRFFSLTQRRSWRGVGSRPVSSRKSSRSSRLSFPFSETRVPFSDVRWDHHAGRRPLLLMRHHRGAKVSGEMSGDDWGASGPLRAPCATGNPRKHQGLRPLTSDC